MGRKTDWQLPPGFADSPVPGSRFRCQPLPVPRFAFQVPGSAFLDGFRRFFSPATGYRLPATGYKSGLDEILASLAFFIP
jgi:hypothetical protein